LQGLFTGFDVAVSPERAAFGAPVLLLGGAISAIFWRRWLLVSQAPHVGEVAGVRSNYWEIGFLMLLAFIFLLGTSASGVPMVLPLLFLSAACVLPWSTTIRTAMMAAVMVGIVQILAGWVLSIEYDWPLSPSVGGVGFGLLVLSHAGVALGRA